MEAEDLIVKAKDIQMLRVTKELQERLMEENVQGKDQHAIETLEMTFDLNQKASKYTHKYRQTLTCICTNLTFCFWPISTTLVIVHLNPWFYCFSSLQTHRRRIRLKQKNLTTLQDEIDKKSHENANLDKQILDVQVSLAEKMNVDDLAGR